LEARIYLTEFKTQLKNIYKKGLPYPLSFATTPEVKKKHRDKDKKKLTKVKNFCNISGTKKKVHLTLSIKLSLSFCRDLLLRPVFQPFLFDLDFHSSCLTYPSLNSLLATAKSCLLEKSKH